MSETPKKLSLDAVLREWPSVDDSQKPAMDWEQMAQRIDERVGAGDAGASVAYVSNENLLADPLGQIEGEGHNSAASVNTAQTRVTKGETMTMPVDRERDRRSLQDLAKMAGVHGAMTPPPPSVNPSGVAAPHSSAPSGVQRGSGVVAEAKKDDSGIVDLAMASQSDPGAAVRAQTTPLASDGLFDDEPASVRPPMSAPHSGAMAGASQGGPVSQQYQQPAPSIPPFASAPLSMPPASVSAPFSSAPASLAPSNAVQSSAQRSVSGEKKRSGVVIALVFGGLMAASAVAAGGFFFIQHRAEKAAQLAQNDTKPTPVVAPEAKPAETAQAAADPTPAPEATVDPNALPNGKVAPVKVAAKGGAPAPFVKAAGPAKPEEAAKLSAKDLPTTPTGPGGDLGSAMGKAVGADGKPVEATPAAGNTGPQFAAGTVPQKPSQGAVTGALGAVMSGARACLGPDDPVSRASVTFTSTGSVQSVNVTGGAAGKPAEGCIKAALGKAKLTPFAEPTYTANITVRH